MQLKTKRENYMPDCNQKGVTSVNFIKAGNVLFESTKENRSGTDTGTSRNMNHIETRNDEAMVNTRPLFSSAWLALFSVLRQHYNGQSVLAVKRSERLRAMREKNPGLNLHPVQPTP
jgi:hypothetical protein